MAASTSAPTRRWRLMRSGARGGIAGYVFILPSLLFIFVFVILPIIAAFYYSVTDYDLMQAPRFAGLKNYKNLFSDPRY